MPAVLDPPPLARKLRTVVLLRCLAVAGLLAIILPQIAELWGEGGLGDGAPVPGAEPTLAMLTRAGAVVLAALGVDVALAVALRFPAGQGRAAVACHVLADLAAVTALVYVTRGPDASPFAMLYFGPVLAASLLWSLPAGLGAACAAAGALAAVDAVWIGASATEAVLPLLGERAPGALAWTSARVVQLVVTAVSFLGVSLLGGTLGGRLSRVHLLLDEVVQNLGEGVVAVDALGRVAFVNREARRLLGTAEARPGGPVAELLDGSAGPLRQLLEQGRGGPVELDLPGADADVPVEATASPVRDEGGTSRGTVVVLRDVSLRREVARARAQAARSAQVREMAAGLAHEIRNPLASIRGALQELMEGTNATTEVRRLMELAVGEADRLNGIISQFLEFAREPEPRPRALAARPLLEEVAMLLRQRELPAGLQVVVDAPAAPGALRADPGQVRQVLLNLGLNAIEAMPRGGTLTFDARPIRAPGHGRDGAAAGVALVVRDTGTGIAEADLPKLGTPFFSTKPRGTGLGLAIVHRIVAAHGGTVRIESVAGAGTTVTCWLPAAESL